MTTSPPTRAADPGPEPPSGYRAILLALDASDHANGALNAAVALAGMTKGARVTGTHAYAAKLHDVRFRQMEGGLPDPFREEQELERQREVHDDLITRGLSIITDCYLDQGERHCREAGVEFARRALEGKNYRELVRETRRGDYDLLVMGAQGVGAVAGGRLGSVCRRVTRRARIDTLVIKEPLRPVAEGPIVVAMDGSQQAYGALVTALWLARRWDVAVKVVAVFDPYFHYVAFNRIAGVLSEQASKVFRFKDQEKLHEEIIDSGLAKIYEGHLTVAESVADEQGLTVETALLDGKPYDAIRKYLIEVQPSLLVLGRVGIHADTDLDIGGNAENLLDEAPCAVLLSNRTYQPRIDVVADVTTSWTHQAQEAMNIVPEFVHNMARMAILRYAQDRGHTVITESIVHEATAALCPTHARQAMAEIVAQASADPDPLPWSAEAQQMLDTIEDPSARDNLRLRAEKKARTDGAATVQAPQVAPFLQETPPPGTGAELHWQAAALARLARVPAGPPREAGRRNIEDYARRSGLREIRLDTAEAGLAQARPASADDLPQVGKCPFSTHGRSSPEALTPAAELNWTAQAQARMSAVPEGFIRDLTRQRIEAFARRTGAGTITAELIEAQYAQWREGSEKQRMKLQWDVGALARIGRIPEFVRGMVAREVERCARATGVTTVTEEVLTQAMADWQGMGAFHSEMRTDPVRS